MMFSVCMSMLLVVANGMTLRPIHSPRLDSSAIHCVVRLGEPTTLLSGRRAMLFGLGTSLLATPAASFAAEAPKWISGKSDPLRPTVKGKPEGTRKDNRYLSCLNDCVPRRQGPPGPNQRERSDCLDDCQIECCETYEQCTYSIKK